MSISTDTLRQIAEHSVSDESRLLATELLAARELRDRHVADMAAVAQRHLDAIARAEQAAAECAQWQAKWEHTIDNAVCGLSRQLQAAEKEAIVKRDEATAWKTMADVRLAERDAARAEVERLKGERSDLLDCVRACLMAAGAPSDIDEMEAVVRSAGTKPSHFVRAQFDRLKAENSTLAAYRERTEPALVELSKSLAVAGFVDVREVTQLGLAREAKGGA